MSLPKFHTEDKTLRNLQDRWASELDPVLNNPISKAIILKKVPLKAGLNKVNHLLSRNLQGWFIVRQRGPASFYDSQDSNATPSLTLALYTSADVIVDIGVF